MSKVVIIDYQLGNLFSVRQALENIGLDVVISHNEDELKSADAAVLPGVGAFADAMKNLEQQNLVEGIHQHIDSGKPFLGVCLGLQLLFHESEEFGSAKGLGVLDGVVRKFQQTTPDGEKIRVPQISWNQIYNNNRSWANTPFDGLDQNEHMYFVHSYYIKPSNEGHTLSYTEYHGQKYTSSIIRDNVFACQFHPEKSAAKGLTIYRNWAAQNNLISSTNHK